MNPSGGNVVDLGPPPRPGVRRAVPNGVLAMAMFVGVEVMLFAGFISAFTIVKASYAPGTWPPPDQPRLPIEATALTTLLLLASGAALWESGRRARREWASLAGLGQPSRVALRWLGLATGMGAAFIAVQGFEWARLLAQGLTLQSSPYGAFFYMIVGAHALHAIPAIFALVYAWLRMSRGALSEEAFATIRLFWYFVVLVWPVLYWKVYL